MKGGRDRQNTDKNRGEEDFGVCRFSQTSKTGGIVPTNCVFRLTVMLTNAVSIGPAIHSHVQGDLHVTHPLVPPPLTCQTSIDQYNVLLTTADECINERHPLIRGNNLTTAER